MSKLTELHETDPADPFIINGIAMECQKFDPEKANSTLPVPVDCHEQRLPVYFQAGRLRNANEALDE